MYDTDTAEYDVRESSVASPEAEALLARLEAEDIRLDQEMNEKWGEGFFENVKERGEAWWNSLVEKGDGFLEWAQEKGLPLPKTRVGMRALAGATGVAGAVVPGLGVFLPAAYLLWKKSSQLPDHALNYA